MRSPIALAGLLGILAATTAGLLFRSQISSGFSDLREGILSAVGLGAAPLVLWVAALVATAILRPRWLRHLPFWAGAAVFTIGITGLLAFFRPFDGPLSWFSDYGQFTLGGQLGDAIIGTPDWSGALRVFAVFLLGVAIAVPLLAADIGRLILQAGIIAYLGLFVAVRSLFTREPKPEPVELDDDDEDWRASFVSSSNGIQVDEPMSGTDRPADLTERYRLPEISTYLDDQPVMESAGPAVESEYGTEPSEGDEFTEWGGIDDGELAPPFEPDSLHQVTRMSEHLGEEPSPEPRTNRFWSTDHGEHSSTPVTREPVSPVPNGANGTVHPGPFMNGTALMWERPNIELLHEAPEIAISEDELRDTAGTITETLGDYGVEVEVGHIRPGPTVTMYGLVPGWVRRTRIVKDTDADGQPKRDEAGRQISRRVEQKTRVKVDTILAREKDLALALRTPSIRIETPAMGKSLVGIEVPNPNPTLVTLRSVMESNDFQKLRMKAHLPIALGRGSGGEAVSFDLAKMPHLLVAGATGSGKSVCLNAIVSCLITERTPSEMRLLLVDPKRVELTPYNGVPHLMAPVVVETDTVVGYLKGLIREMNDRYRRMEEVGVRNIEGYNERMPDRMPYLCVVVDELADLMMTAAFDVEQSLCRLAQLGRATGIHLIIATQRPSVDVVTGLIKANFPSRVSFAVTSQVDSRTILDTAGADKLLGRGDMLYLPLDASKPSRVQNVFIGDDEIERLVNFWTDTPWPAFQQIDLLGGSDEHDELEATETDSPDRDNMMDKAIELALSHRKLSTSLLQRRLRIGYPRAARLMDQLEDEGVVGPGDGSKSRDVIINHT